MLLYCGVLLLAMVSTLIISLPDSEYYHILNKISHSVLGSYHRNVRSFIISSVAIQFGTNQLQGAPNQLLSAFVFWYFTADILLDRLIWLTIYLL